MKKFVRSLFLVIEEGWLAFKYAALPSSVAKLYFNPTDEAASDPATDDAADRVLLETGHETDAKIEQA